MRRLCLFLLSLVVFGIDEEKTCSNENCRIKLTYFDVKARAEPIRIALRRANLNFIDERLSYESWIGGIKEQTPSGSLPVLEINGKTYTQSVAIARWAAKQSDLYPQDALEALAADEIMDVVQEILTKAPSPSDLTEKERLRKEYATGFMKKKNEFPCFQDCWTIYSWLPDLHCRPSPIFLFIRYASFW
mmetsp:Transcript_14379/g.17399  ORF Transcript_14379/g.17399 Transcript_14379/m.17399 type:complete len:189 (+) Transcript_14379:39-605(+)